MEDGEICGWLLESVDDGRWEFEVATLERKNTMGKGQMRQFHSD